MTLTEWGEGREREGGWRREGGKERERKMK
jgi:hypothetical protein